jgi:very-short-patch-repair endonuclease
MRHSQPWRTNRARVLRANDTSAEAKLWAELRNRQLGDLKFVRQAPVGDYFVDFLCRERMVVVEIDGGTHSTDAELASDAVRSDELSARGYRVFRVSNDDVFRRIDEVLAALLAFAAPDGET